MINSWGEFIKEETINGSLKESWKKIAMGYKSNVPLVPKYENVFRAFKETPIDKLKVVILGMDPYPQVGIADGLAFSTKSDKTPESLRIIFKELSTDVFEAKDAEEYGRLFRSNDLTWWAKQGVLLLNSSLTTEVGKVGVHFKYWNSFILKLIQELDEFPRPLVFMLWGVHAQKFLPYITRGKPQLSLRYNVKPDLDTKLTCKEEFHKVLIASHPNAEYHGSGGFYKCKHFSIANRFIKKEYGELYTIDWRTYSNGEDGLPIDMVYQDWESYCEGKKREIRKWQVIR